MLTEEEQEEIRNKLGRDPSAAEEATLDALWSEHCSYKSSKRWFHLFNTESDRVHLGIGEGAGLVDVGDGYVIGLGLESHNHPSAVDPFNGAATGVGGIIRDIISQGCRPVAILDCLRFGLPTTPRQKLLLDQVVLGISSYGNCVGIPNQGGDLEFAPEFAKNPLVNAMCIGVAHKDEIIRSIAKNTGDKLILFGSSSGRDGIGGVTFASEELDDSQQENRGSVQIGDPLTEKILIDAIIELRDKKLLSGLQDLGGGGLVCAAVEMAEKGEKGVRLHLDEVPLREDDMRGWEILVSESQERMLAVVSPDNVSEVTQILDFYELNWAVVGDITEGNTFESHFHDHQETNLPVDFTINGFPEPKRVVGERSAKEDQPTTPEGHPLEVLLSLYNISSRQPIYQQYDQHVQGNTVFGAERDSGVIRLPNDKFLASAAGTNSYLVSLEPRKGAALATMAIARKVIARGGLPIALVDSLNAGNPEKPESYREFVDMIKGVADFSHKMETPVVGGNVSLYNESDKEGEVHKILPSPFVGIAGLIDADYIIPERLDPQISSVYLLGPEQGYLKGSEFGRYYGYQDDFIVDFTQEAEVMRTILDHRDIFKSCTPVGKGGLAVTVSKWAIQSKVGIELTRLGDDKYLYGENAPRYLVQMTENDATKLTQANPSLNVMKIGQVRKDRRIVLDIEWNISDLEETWKRPLFSAMTT